MRHLRLDTMTLRPSQTTPSNNAAARAADSYTPPTHAQTRTTRRCRCRQGVLADVRFDLLGPDCRARGHSGRGARPMPCRSPCVHPADVAAMHADAILMLSSLHTTTHYSLSTDSLSANLDHYYPHPHTHAHPHARTQTAFSSDARGARHSARSVRSEEKKARRGAPAPLLTHTHTLGARLRRCLGSRPWAARVAGPVSDTHSHGEDHAPHARTHTRRGREKNV